MQILGKEKPSRSYERDGDDGKRVSAPDGKRDKPSRETKMNFDPNKPLVSLRRFTDPVERLAIKEYILNRNKRPENEMIALENVYRILGRG